MQKTPRGKIIQVIGPVVDVDFGDPSAGSGQEMPALFSALEISFSANEGKSIIAEVAKHLEPGRVRAVALASTDGLRRGDEVTDTGKPITVPVGPKVLGNIF